MSSDGNPRIRLRLSPAMQAVVAHAQGAGPEATAIRALLILGAAQAGLDVSGVGREIAQAQIEPLHPAVITALRAVQHTEHEGGSRVAAGWQPGGSRVAATPVEDDVPPDVAESDPFSFGIDV